MFLVTVAANAQTPTGKVGCNLQNSKNPAAKIPTTTENLDWILHGNPIQGIAYYNDRLMPGAAEYSANAALARSVSMQALCMELNGINQLKGGALKKSANGQIVEITPDVVLRNEQWLKTSTESMKIDFGNNPIALVAVNLVSRSIDTVIHPNGLGVQSVTVLKVAGDTFPLFLDPCGNEGGADFVFALRNKTAKIVAAGPSAGTPGSVPPVGTPATAGVDPQILKLIEANNKSILDALKANESTKGSPIFINSPVLVNGGNTLTTTGGQNGQNGRDGASASTTTTTTGGTIPGFQTPAPGTVVQPVSSGQWVQVGAQGVPQSAGIACANCPGSQGGNSAWNRQDVGYVEGQLAANNQYNAAMLKQMKTANTLSGLNLVANFANAGFNGANTINHWNDHGSTVNVYGGGVATPPTVPGGPVNWPNGTNVAQTDTGSPSDNPNGF